MKKLGWMSWIVLLALAGFGYWLLAKAGVVGDSSKTAATSTVNLKKGGVVVGSYPVPESAWAKLLTKTGGFDVMPVIPGVACAMELWFANYYAEGKTDIDHSPGASTWLRAHGVPQWGLGGAGGNVNLAVAYWAKYGRPYAFANVPELTATQDVAAPDPTGGDTSEGDVDEDGLVTFTLRDNTDKTTPTYSAKVTPAALAGSRRRPTRQPPQDALVPTANEYGWNWPSATVLACRLKRSSVSG